jgi:hypothetical protein
MRSNGIFSALSGAVLLVGAKPVALFMGISIPTALVGIGWVLLLYAVTLFLVTARPQVDVRLGYIAVALDVAWVVGSIVILSTDLLPLTVAGKWMVALLAEVVAGFAVWQAYALSKKGKAS